MFIAWLAVSVNLLFYFFPLTYSNPLLIPMRILPLVAGVACLFYKGVVARASGVLVLALVLQSWMIASALHADLFLGRPLDLGRPLFWLIEGLLPYVAAITLCAVRSTARESVMRATFWFVSISCAFAWLQFMRIPPALAIGDIYSYKDIEAWDGASGVRAVGLSRHPISLTFHAILGFALVSRAALWRKLDAREIAGLFFFSGAALVSQGRTGYIAFGIAWLILLGLWFRRDPLKAISVVMVGAALIVTAISIAPVRFGYVRNNQETSFDHREMLWERNLKPILPDLMVTGVGPSQGLFANMGPEDKYVPYGNHMESGYLLMLAMYGSIGLMLFLLLLVYAAGSAVVVIAKNRGSPDLQGAGYVALLAVIFFAVFCYSSNGIDSYQIVPHLWLLAGLAVPVARLEDPLGRG